MPRKGPIGLPSARFADSGRIAAVESKPAISTIKDFHVTRSLNSVNRFILASAALTLAVALVVSQARRSDNFGRFLGSFERSQSIDHASTIKDDLIRRLAGADDKTLVSEITAFVVSSNPTAISQVVGQLYEREMPKEAKKIAITLAEIGGTRYKVISLIQMAASEYIVGRFVERDLGKAEALLNDPILANLPSTQYFLGVFWGSVHNPRRNAALARDYMQKAADGGFQPAIAALPNLSGG